MCNMDLKNFLLTYCLILILLVSAHEQKEFSVNSDIGDLNSDIYLDSQQFIAKYSDINPEKHLVTTKDSYVISLFRIPANGPPVILVHGISDSSDSWLVLGAENSLAFQLSDAGFDVWMYNARGNKYSKSHRKNITNKAYWDFSFEEMGTLDLPAAIDYILAVTSHQKLSYVGFSQGTTIFFTMCSLRPEYNERINHAILLAPVAWLNNIKYPLIKFFTNNLDRIAFLADLFGVYEVFSSNPVRTVYYAKACRDGSLNKVLCDLEYYISYGIKNTENIPSESFPVIASHIPAGTSAKTFKHFLQIYRSKRFQRFDNGLDENKRIYGQSQPPEYNLSNISVPLTMIASEVDWFSNIKNVRILTSKLPNVVRFIVLNKTLDFSHLEFVYGTRANNLINDPVINILSGYSNKIV